MRRSARHIDIRIACASALAIALALGAPPAFAGTASKAASVSPALRAQARELYAPVRTYEHSTTAVQRAQSRAAGRAAGKLIGTCQAPYLKRLLSRREVKLDTLWNDATLLETYQADVRPVATALMTLAGSWSRLSLRNRAMNQFVHAVATELQATLHAPPLDSCAFVDGIAAHHFSYTWARRSSYGLEAARWREQISHAGNRTGAFWLDVYPIEPGAPPSQKLVTDLFTKAELDVLANLPGELG